MSPSPNHDKPSTAGSMGRWISRVRDGDPDAETRLWRLYFDRLVRTVRPRIDRRHRAVLDEEDIVVSVFDSFYDAAKQGRFPSLQDKDDLWRLLLRMATRKIIDKRRLMRRQRRGGDQTIQSLDVEHDGEIFEAVSSEPPAELTLMVKESMEEFLSIFGGGQLQEIAVAKLEGASNSEIAKSLGCSERTIERRLHLIREKFLQESEGDEHSATEDTNPRLRND